MNPLLRIFLACMAAIWLSSCAHSPKERIVIQEVKIPVPCAVELPPESQLPIFQKPAETDIERQMLTALATIETLRGDLKEARAAATGCKP